jgi:outer membrane protein TolC
LAPTAGGLTADQAAASARQTAPSVEVANAQVAASLARTRQTLSRYVPNLTVQAGYLRKNGVDYDFSGDGFSAFALSEGGLQVGTCPDGVGNNCVVDSAGLPVVAVAPASFTIPQNNYSVQMNLSVPFSDYALALSPARKAAAADEAVAELHKQAEIDTVDVNARIAYYDWVKARAQLAIARQSLASAQARLEDARMGVAAGTITTADGLGLESLVASSEVVVAQAQSFVRLAEQNLILMSQWPGPLVIGEDLSRSTAPIQELGSLAELIKHGQENRAEMRALRQSATASRYASDGAAAALYPRVDGIANVTHANPNQGFFPPGPEWKTSWYVGVNVTWRLDGFLGTRAQIREIDANTRLLRAQRAALARAIEMEVRGAWEQWQRADAARRISETELRAAEAMHRQRAALFRGGEATSTEVVEAELQRHNATLRKVNASIDKRIALARIRRAAGLPRDAKDPGQ